MSKQIIWTILILLGIAIGFWFYRAGTALGGRSNHFGEFIRNPASHPNWKLAAGSRCGEAPFIFPTTGMIGFIWDDSFGAGHRHQGIDIFSGTDIGLTPISAAYDGYLTRQADWKSSVIMRVPNDPLEPARQIWLYYTHMADAAGNSFISADFPPGTREVFVAAGTFLGTMGNYSGDATHPVGVHLHFSVVRDDGNGGFKNELDIRNTYDPSPYLGIELNANRSQGEVPLCAPTPDRP